MSDTERLEARITELATRLDELERGAWLDRRTVSELDVQVNALEAVLTDVCKLFKTYKWRLPGALLAWYSKQVGPG